MADILEKEILGLGKSIFADIQESSRSLFNADFYIGKLLDLTMHNEDVKVSFFRFVDVLPSLDTSAAIVSHVQEYFDPVANKMPELLRQGLKLNALHLAAPIISHAIKRQVEFVAKRFIIGETARDALKVLRKIRSRKMCFTVDLLGEATLSDKESVEYLNRYFELIETLGKETVKWPESEPIIPGHKGEETPMNISVKLSALYPNCSVLNYEKAKEVLAERLSLIAEKAKTHNAWLFVDMEDTSLTSLTLDVFKTVFGSTKLKEFTRCGIVLQAYLRRTEEDLDALIAWAKNRGTPIGVRLVKGAYWDTETIYCKQKDWAIPVWQNKENSDAQYEKLTLALLKNHKHIYPAFGSHNVRSLCHAIKAAEAFGIPPTEYELQVLYGMGDLIKKAFVKRGYLVREYAPIGELLPGMSYLVRRLLENTSNEGFLKQSFHDNTDIEKLLKKPLFNSSDTGQTHLHKNVKTTFSNCPLIDFSEKAEREKLKQSLSELKEKLRAKPISVFPIIEGTKQETDNSFFGVSPEDNSFKIASVHTANMTQAESAVQSLLAFFPSWRETSVAERAAFLFKAADVLTERKAYFTSLIILEAGKPWAEADADVAEAIDFLNYYALQALELQSPKKLGNHPGEVNTLSYEPRGVTTVIAPWNFPLAIACGMFSASLVTGNCTILKPAEQSSLIASEFFNLLLEIGVPAKAMAFLPGFGEEIGAYLVNHPKVSTIAFTGSKNVGLEIIKAAGHTDSANQIHVKRVIAEMGGKNAIIVDEDADLDEAIKGVLHSAFGYAGQKCSACSRVIVVGSRYEVFKTRLGEALSSLVVGPASAPETQVGPVIDKEAQDRITKCIASAKKDCKVLAEFPLNSTTATQGTFVAPIIFCDIPANHPILTTEIFGPVLALLHTDSFDKAIDIALAPEYALTGAVFSRSPKNIEKAVANFRVGNLYINRGSTGALVMRQPFGGARMSGVGSKAGGPDYLHQFVIPRCVTENTVRRGFAPE